MPRYHFGDDSILAQDKGWPNNGVWEIKIKINSFAAVSESYPSYIHYFLLPTVVMDIRCGAFVNRSLLYIYCTFCGMKM